MTNRVLIVDDDPALAEMLGIVLRGEGYDVSHVADGSAALGSFRDFKPDLVLLDVMLPGMNGVEVCRKIRAESVVPIIMLTARTDTLDVVGGLEAGAQLVQCGVKAGSDHAAIAHQGGRLGGDGAQQQGGAVGGRQQVGKNLSQIGLWRRWGLR